MRAREWSQFSSLIMNQKKTYLGENHENRLNKQGDFKTVSQPEEASSNIGYKALGTSVSVRAHGVTSLLTEWRRHPERSR